MCKITDFKDYPIEKLLNVLGDEQCKGFSLHTKDCRDKIKFKTSHGNVYSGVDKIIIVTHNKKGGSNDRFIPHKQMKNIFSQFGIEDLFIDDLKKEFPSLAFIAKNPSGGVYRQTV